MDAALGGCFCRVTSRVSMPVAVVPRKRTVFAVPSAVSGRKLVSPGLAINSTAVRNEGLFKTVNSSAALALMPDSTSLEKTSRGIPANLQDAFQSLITEVCDETSIAEVKLKIGNMEMNMKRNVGVQPIKIPPSSLSEAPKSNELKAESTPALPQPSPPSIPGVSNISPFKSKELSKELRLADVVASVGDAYVLLPSPTVGTFWVSRFISGKGTRVLCKKGDIIKKGQIVGYVSQLGNQFPVKSDVAGEVIKVLCIEGETVGFSDPLVAVLPSFHDIK